MAWACVTNCELGHLGKKVGVSHLIRDVKIVKIWTSFGVKAAHVGVNMSGNSN